jgi:hypothetical protein
LETDGGAAAQFSVDTQGTLDGGERVEEDTQFTLTGEDADDSTGPLPGAWRRDGDLTWRAGPYVVSVRSNYDDGNEQFDVRLIGEDNKESIAEGVETKERTRDIADEFTDRLAPDEVSFHTEDSAVIEAAAEAKAATTSDEGGIFDYMADDGDVYDPSADAEQQEVRFGTLDTANEFRDDHEEHVADNDKRNMKTVRFDPDTPDNVIDAAETDALVSRGDETKKYDQAKLTDDEKEQLKARDGWTWNQNGFEAMYAKGALTAEGATDWLNYYEAGMDQSDALAMLEQGKEAEAATGAGTGIQAERVDSEDSVAARARQVEKFEAAACEQAKEACSDGFEEACATLRDECGFGDDEIEEVLASTDRWHTEMDDLATDDGGVPDASEIDVTIPESEELPKFARKTLWRAWRGYRAAAGDARDAKDAIDRYRESREEAREYGAIINEVRKTFGQDPIDIESQVEGDEVALSDLPDVEWTHAGDTSPTNEDVTEQVTLGWKPTTLKGWAKHAKSGGTYDPTDEFGGV